MNQHDVVGLKCPEVEAMAVEDYLRLTTLAGEAREIRVLHGQTKHQTRTATYVGQFTEQSIPWMARSLGRMPWVTYGGIYVTVNPVSSSYLSKQEGSRTGVSIATSCAKDADIAMRRWLLVDLDAKRVKNHDPSSDEEHEFTVTKAREMIHALAAKGWPRPIMVDSGNGVQLFWRVDLPANDGGLCKRVLQALSHDFSDEHVTIDLTVHNAARLCRVAGTWNIKGAEFPEEQRRYRLSRVLFAPPTLEVVPELLLTQMAQSIIPVQTEAQLWGTPRPPAPHGSVEAVRGRLPSASHEEARCSTPCNHADGATESGNAGAVPQTPATNGTNGGLMCATANADGVKRADGGMRADGTPSATVQATGLTGLAKRAFDIDSFMAMHFPESRAVAYDGGRKWVLKVCPFNPEHNRGEAVVIEGPDGSLGFRCHHNSCAGHDWQAFRAKFDPVYAQRLAVKSATAALPPPAEDVSTEVAPEDSWLRPGDALVRFPVLREPIIEGVLRKGETMNVIAAPKMGKSWLTMQLAHCVATGTPWLGHECVRQKVLYIDNELHGETFADRLRTVHAAMGLDVDALAEWMRLKLLRGHLEGLDRTLASVEARVREEGIGLVIIDALYRALPEGFDENSNADMRLLYNMIDRFTRDTGASVVLVHHTSKGDQREKGVTDIGAGAGAVSRATDTHLVILPHGEVPDAGLVCVTTRSFPKSEEWCLRRRGPLWTVASDLTKEGKVQASTPLAPRLSVETVVKVLTRLGGNSGKTALQKQLCATCHCRSTEGWDAIERALSRREVREVCEGRRKFIVLPKAPPSPIDAMDPEDVPF